MIFKKGMSLIEVVAAVALAVLAMGGIISVTTQSASLGQTVDYTYAASNLAKNRIERIREIRRDKGYEALCEASETDTVIDINGNPDPNGDFVRTTTISASYAPDLKQVTVKVQYKKRGTLIPIGIELVTMVSRYT
jgi:Tfp pilus assembly protein PilV